MRAAFVLSILFLAAGCGSDDEGDGAAADAGGREGDGGEDRDAATGTPVDAVVDAGADAAVAPADDAALAVDAAADAAVDAAEATPDAGSDAGADAAPADAPPVADPGADGDVQLGRGYTLDGSGSSDPEGHALTYAWSLTSAPAGSAAALSDATLVSPTFTADLLGSYVFSLVVDDGTAASDAVSVTVRAHLLARTGADGCVDAAASVACTGTGQDGELRSGAPWPEPRFTDHGDGTVTDELTGLMWLRDASCARTLHQNPDGLGDGNLSWQSALDFAAAINAGTLDPASCAGYTAAHVDWRLPNRRELLSLVSYADGGAGLPAGHPFVSPGTHYWSSSSYVSDAAGLAWYLRQRSIDYDLKGNGHGVWLVRGSSSVLARTGQTLCHDTDGNEIACAGTGQDGEHQAGVAWPSPRFTVHGDGTVTDELTGLMWLADATCSATVDWDGSGTGETDWLEALAFVAAINDGSRDIGACAGYTAGYDDWRLPNVLELDSLTLAGQHLTWLSAEGFVGVVAGWNRCWSSTHDGAGDAFDLIGWGHLTSVASPPEADVHAFPWPVRGP